MNKQFKIFSEDLQSMQKGSALSALLSDFLPGLGQNESSESIRPLLKGLSFEHQMLLMRLNFELKTDSVEEEAEKNQKQLKELNQEVQNFSKESPKVHKPLYSGYKPALDLESVGSPSASMASKNKEQEEDDIERLLKDLVV